MIRSLELFLLPQQAADREKQAEKAAEILSVTRASISHLRILKRSIDARSKQPKVRLFIEVFVDEPAPPSKDFTGEFQFDRDVSGSPSAMIIGFGPAGMFAALRMIELGIKPVILERGKDIQNRRRDLATINKQGVVNPESNYCFGEGGAGTYSDGKLYTRSGKRGDINRILKILVMHGAPEDILIDAHPHIGTNKLPKVVESIRLTILRAGGEIHFDTKLTDLIVESNSVKGVRGETAGAIKDFPSHQVILATGHSARDIFYLLGRKNIRMEAKPFALGIRMEHPQQIIDTLQYHCDPRGDFLPPASYSISNQAFGKGVYSFCMCPGGIIAPAATGESEIVVNGWSPSKRNNPFANSGLVASVDEKDYASRNAGAFSALLYQQEVEQKSFLYGGGLLKAPAQRLVDFAEGKNTGSLPVCSYIPGITPAALSEILPPEIYRPIRESLKVFGKKMKSLYTNDAVLVATESRTSSPVRIPRSPDTLEHPDVQGLFPCGEGAGYAGGIVSAAMDGERCAEAVMKLQG